MAEDKTEIANLAGQILGADQIMDLDEAENRTARELLLAYGPNLDELLASHDWNFARDRASVPKLSTVPAFKYKFEYGWPKDAVEILSIDEGFSREGGENNTAGRLGGGDVYGSGTQFEVEGLKILTSKDIITDLKVVNVPGLPVTFTKRITQVAVYPAWFVTALYTRLAVQTAEAITGSNTLSAKAQGLFNKAFKFARWKNAQQGKQQRPLGTFLSVKAS